MSGAASRMDPPEVYSVTQARPGSSDDLQRRTRRYLISMGIRTACFILAVVVHGPLRWVLVAAALVLPYVAVVMVNAVGSAPVAQPTPYAEVQGTLGSAQRRVLEPDGPEGAPRDTSA